MYSLNHKLHVKDNKQLSRTLKNRDIFQHAFVRVLFQFILLMNILIPVASVTAMPIITNTATANYTINGVNLNINDSAQFTRDTVVTPTDTINLLKRANTSSVNVGNNITYTLTLDNPNPRILTNVVIQDNLPTGLNYVINSARLNNTNIASNQINNTGNVLSLNIGDIPANTTWNISYQTNVSSNTPIGNTINKAIAITDTVTSSQAQATVRINPPIIVVPEVPLKPLELDKVANANEAKIGDTVSYTITVKNNNLSNVTGSVINDALPEGLEYITGSAQLNNQNIVATANQDSQVSFDLGNLQANSISVLTYDALVKSLENNNRALINTAEVIADDPKANSNSDSATINVIDDEILITKTTTSTRVTAGEIVDYTITVSNPLNRDLSDLIITDTLPTGFLYETDSTLVNNNPLSDDDISINTPTLIFNIGTLATTSSVVLSYKVKVNSSAVPGENINTARAGSEFASSPSVSATVTVRTPSKIEFLSINESGISSVIQPTSFNTNQDGGKNFEEIKAISLPNGSNISLPTPQPISLANQYTEGEPIVIQVTDLDQNTDPNKFETIEVTVNVPGTNDTEILLLTETSPNSGIFRGIVQTDTGSSNIQNGIITIAEGVNIQVNYRDGEDNTDTSATAALVIPNTNLDIEKSVDKEVSSVGELVRYTLVFRNNNGFELTNLQIHDLLPLGFRYIPDTAELNGERIANEPLFNGRSLTFNLQNMPNNGIWTLEYVTKISAGVQIGDAINTAYFTSGTLRSNDAKATVEIKDDLMRSKNILTGRVYIGCKTTSDKDEEPPRVLRDARIYMETGRSVLTDEEGFWRMEGVNPGAHVLQLDTESIPGYEPMLCHDNTRRARDAKSHFVDLQAGNLWHVDFHVKEIKGYVANQSSKLNKPKAQNPFELFGKEYLKKAPEGFDILWPKNNYIPPIGSSDIFVKTSPQEKVEVFVNGKKVPALNYDGSNTNKERTVIVRRWKGVDIDINTTNNTLLVVLKDKSGKELSRKTRNIHFSSNPVSAELLKDRSILVADGKTTPVLAVRIKDEHGFPMRANTNGYFTIENSKYSVKTHNTDDNNENNLNESLAGTYKYEIEEGGIAWIELNPTTQSGKIKLNLEFTDSNATKKSSEITAWLKPALRDWIMVGIAEGTLAYKNLSGNMRALKDLNKIEDFSKRGRVAFFAKGEVKGKYLLTVAYDTHKQNREIGSQLNGNIDPDAFYTIYADNSNSQYDAPSSEKLYLKLERDNFYALFGDYQTNMTVTELASYQRTLNGIKTEYQGDKFSYEAFISETSNNHQHEEIQGDGTSGLYRLNGDIIPNSETIVIETRDRFRSDKILVRRQLIRYQDYNINYKEGTLFFKFPITSRDSNFNPNIIVADYDSESDSNESITAGGRIAMKSMQGKLETGISFINEGQSNQDDNQLIATDLSYKITPDTKVNIEVAQSKTEASEFEKRNAYILELEKEIEDMEARFYMKKQEANFGIDSQASESGTTKIGAEVDYRINEKTRINSEVLVQKNLENDNKRRLGQINLTHEYKQYDFNIGYRHTQEELLDENNQTKSLNSDTVILGGSYTTKDDKVTLRSTLEKNISSANGSEVSPDRLVFGVDVKLAQGFSVFAENETTDNGNIKTNNSRVGVSKDLWKGAKARTTYTQERTDQGQRNYATLGLSQTVKLSDKISADFSIDQAKTISGNKTQSRFNLDEPVINGAQSDDYTAFSVGLGANEKDWSWTTRAEYRNGELEDKINFIASAIRHYDNGKNLSVKLSYYDTDNENGDFDTETKLSFGSAWHPKEKDYVFFSRLDLIDSKSSSSFNDSVNAFATTDKSDTQKVIHNMHYNRKINNKTQLGFHHGIKHIKDENNGVKTSSTVDTGTLEVRRDITKRVDVGVHGGYLRDWDEKATEYVAGVSLGVNPTKNIWMEVGYNVEGFKDEDFDNNKQTSDGVYLDFRYKFNQDTIKEDLHMHRKHKKKNTTQKNKNNIGVNPKNVTALY